MFQIATIICITKNNLTKNPNFSYTYSTILTFDIQIFVNINQCFKIYIQIY